MASGAGSFSCSPDVRPLPGGRPPLQWVALGMALLAGFAVGMAVQLAHGGSPNEGLAAYTAPTSARTALQAGVAVQQQVAPRPSQAITSIASMGKRQYASAPRGPLQRSHQLNASGEPLTDHHPNRLWAGLAAAMSTFLLGWWFAAQKPSRSVEGQAGQLLPSRREALSSLMATAVALPVAEAFASPPGGEIQVYSDYTRLPSGVQFKDAKVGAGDKTVSVGDRVVYTWEGYTVGYFGRPFQKNNGPIGGSFADDSAYSRFKVGSGEVIGALDEGVQGMREGGVRQIIIPPGPLSYPESDPNHTLVGPAPTTFSGLRALNFVLFNVGGAMDKTLLINVKVIRIDKPGEKGFAG